MDINSPYMNRVKFSCYWSEKKICLIYTYHIYTYLIYAQNPPVLEEQKKNACNLYIVRTYLDLSVNSIVFFYPNPLLLEELSWTGHCFLNKIIMEKLNWLLLVSPLGIITLVPN